MERDWGDWVEFIRKTDFQNLKYFLVIYYGGEYLELTVINLCKIKILYITERAE